MLRPLPASRDVISHWKTAKVNIDYPIEFEGRYHSVPHRFVGAKIHVRVTGNLSGCFASSQCVASHAVSTKRGVFYATTDPMPASHHAHLESGCICSRPVGPPEQGANT